LAQKCWPTKFRFLSPYTRAKWIALSLVTWDIATRRRIDKLVRTPAATADMVVRLSPDGKLLALLSTDGLRLFDGATRQPIGEVFGGRGLITPQEHGHVGFSPDGKQFVAGREFQIGGERVSKPAISSCLHFLIRL